MSVMSTNSVGPIIFSQKSPEFCNQIFKKIVDKYQKSHELIYKDFLTECDDLLEKSIGDSFEIVSPICISINEKVSNYRNENDMSVIKNGDVIKIETSILAKGENVYHYYGNTFVFGEPEHFIPAFLKNLEKKIKSKFKSTKEYTTDDVRIYIEEKCLENKVFPILNNSSFNQEMDGELYEYINLNYRKYYNEDDSLVQENYCFDLIKDSVYNMNIAVVPIEFLELCNGDNTWSERESYIAKITGQTYNLKLKNSRRLYSQLKKKYNRNYFIKSRHNSSGDRIGMVECIEHGVIEESPVIFNKNSIPIYSRKFTWVIS